MRTSRSLVRAISCLLVLVVCPALHAQTFVQVNSAGPSSASHVSVTYTQAQVSGDLNVVVVGWKDTLATVSSVTDTAGNVYTLGLGPTILSSQLTQSIYFAKNIVAAPAGSNAVTVTFSTAATSPDVRILEYSGIDANAPLDAAAGASGSNATTDSGPVATTYANDLLIGASVVTTSTTAPGVGYTARLVSAPSGDLVEDTLVTAAGTYDATSSLSSAGAWVMQVVAFKAAGAPPAPSAPANLTALGASSSQINLSWTAATGGTISAYLIERCQGAACTTFAQIATSTATAFTDTGLAAGTTYNYRVRAEDSLNHLGLYSNVATAITRGLPLPSAPGNLTAIAGTSAPIVLAEQGYISPFLQTTHTTAEFDSTGGDLLVLFASSHAGVTFTPSDSFGNVWISAAGPTSTTAGFDLRSQVWYSRNPIVGPNHTVTMALSAGQPLVMSVIVAKGSNISSPIGAASAIGSDNGTQSVNLASPAITTTAANELLIGFAKVSSGSVFQPGTGYTQQAAASSNYLDAETGLAATSGSYSATFTVGAPVSWQSAASAISPAVASDPNHVNLSWVASAESGGTISGYFVERCQGSGCIAFSQIGSSTTTTYNDTGLTASTTYSYRVRAQDSSGNVGPYSNTATITTPAAVPAPSITSLSPTSGPVGTAVTIAGTNFGATQGTSTVSFNGTTATPTSWSNTSIVAPVPSGATSGNVTVTVGGQLSNGLAFTVTIPVPSITSLSPASGPVGTSVTISGANFGATQGASTVSFNGATATPTSWSNTSIVAPVPVGVTTGSVIVTVGGQASNGIVFTIAAAPPPGTIAHIQQGANSDVTGRSFTAFSASFPAATSSGDAMIVGVTYGNTNPTITATDTQGNLYTRAIATYDLNHNQGCAILYAINTRGNAANTVTVNFSSAVAYLGLGIHEYSGVAGLDVTAGNKGSGSGPSSGSAITTANGDLLFSCVTEDAIGKGDTFTAGGGFTKRVDLGIAAAYADEDGIQAAAGAVAATWTLSPSSDWVANMAAFKAASGSTAPSITSLSPTSGPVGTAVTITGANFGVTQGTSMVNFNGTTATPTSWSSTSIIVPVPTGATTGNVVATVGGQTSNGIAFTLTP